MTALAREVRVGEGNAAGPPAGTGAGGRPALSVVTPVYGNAATLGELRRRVAGALAGRAAYELLFVDDASPDGSAALLEELAAVAPEVGVLRLGRNVGQHRAVLAGLAHAAGERVVVLDADLQDPPEAIPALLERLDRGAAAVFAGRRGRYESAGRLVTSRLFKRALALLLRVPPDAGLYLAMDRRMVERLLAFRVERPFLVALAGATGLPLASVPVERARRTVGRSAYGSWRRLRVGTGALLWALAWRLGAARRTGAPPAPPEVRARLGRLAHPS